jgi:hypothetical protein
MDLVSTNAICAWETLKTGKAQYEKQDNFHNNFEVTILNWNIVNSGCVGGIPAVDIWLMRRVAINKKTDMKYFLILIIPIILLSEGLVAGPQRPTSTNTKLLRIAIAGLSIESSTFSPALTDEEAFHARYGTSVFTLYPFYLLIRPFAKEPIGFRSLSVMPTGGAVTRQAYESLVAKTLDSLRKTGLTDCFSISTGHSVVGRMIRKVILFQDP